MAKIVNTFNRGMDQDSSKNLYNDQSYYEANNVRIHTQGGLSSGALEDVQGTIERLDLGSDGAWGPLNIVGYCILRDEIIIFATTNTGAPVYNDTERDYVLSIPMEEIETLSGIPDTYTVTLEYRNIDPNGNIIWRTGWNAILLEHLPSIGFSLQNPINAVARYETEHIQKVYWVDGHNPLRYLNVVFDEETNDLVNLPSDRLEVISDLEISKPRIDVLTSGNLFAGRIQYCYQLYNLYGSETVISPVSDLVNITSSNEGGARSDDYKGNLLDDQCGKGVRGYVRLYSRYYTRIRFIAIHWTSLDADPEVRIFEEKDIPPFPTGMIFTGQAIFFNDIGETILNLTLEDIRLLGTVIFDAEVIETKDNILFAGNITERSFDVEYDARAYRFAGESATPTDPNYNADAVIAPSIGTRGIAKLYDEDLVYYYWVYPDHTWYYQSVSPGPVQADWATLPADIDAINTFNNLDNDGIHTSRFMYQSDGVTLGGEGPNISYVFGVRRGGIDSDVTSDSMFTYQDSRIPSTGDPDNYSFYGPTSPYNAARYLGYHRDEIYRFGIVFFDKKGRASFVKWIGDIRMPSQSTINHADLDTSLPDRVFRISYEDGAGGAHLYTLFIEFDVDNIPAEAEGYQIVRVSRGRTDHTVLGQGLANSMTYPVATNTAHHEQWSHQKVVQDDGRELFHFMSPEVSFNQNIIPSAVDKVQVISSYTTEGGYDTRSNGDQVSYKYSHYNPLNNPQTPYGAGVDDEFHDKNFAGVKEGYLVKQLDQQVNIDIYTYFLENVANIKLKGLMFLMDLDIIRWNPKYTLVNHRPLVNYRKNLWLGHYGGISYVQRKTSRYQAAGDPVNLDFLNPPELEDQKRVYGGDTYLTMFDCLYNSHKVDDTAGTPAVDMEVIYMACESSINTALRVDECMSRVVAVPNSFLMQDTAGTHVTNTLEYNQVTDLYIYEPFYSKENTAKAFIDKPFDWVEQEKFDTRIYASNVKTNGEQIDSWLQFPANQFIEVDPQFGPLTVLQTVGEQLLFFQSDAFGDLAVNDQALIQTGNIAQLSLGTSGVLTRYDYHKLYVGCSHWRHLVLSRNGLYWTDIVNRAMYQFIEGMDEISLLKGMDSWFRENLPTVDNFTKTIGDAMHMFHDPEFREIYLVDNTENFGLVYNEVNQSFLTFTDLQPTYAINYRDKVLGTTDENIFHKHNDLDGHRGEIYDTYREISITFLINPSKNDIGIFNNFEWLTECFNVSPIFGEQDQPVTFDEVRLWNDYQSVLPITLVVGQEIKRRMRKWRYIIPRATRQRSGLLPLDEKYARFRDTHLFSKFSYLNATANRRFVIHDMITSVTISNN